MAYEINIFVNAHGKLELDVDPFEISVYRESKRVNSCLRSMNQSIAHIITLSSPIRKQLIFIESITTYLKSLKQSQLMRALGRCLLSPVMKSPIAIQQSPRVTSMLLNQWWQQSYEAI